MNTYHVFYKGKKLELDAETSYKAQVAGAIEFKAKRSYQVTAVLVGKAGAQVSHSTAEFG